MKLREYHFLTILLIGLACLLVAPGKDFPSGNASWRLSPGWSLPGYQQGIPPLLAGSYQPYSFSPDKASSTFGKASSRRTVHNQKRHRKTLISEAIVADFSVPAPHFVYCSKKYHLFLPGGCPQQPLTHSCLRGPPFLLLTGRQPFSVSSTSY